MNPPVIMVADRSYYNANQPSPEQLTLENIAISLGNTCRWGGHLGNYTLNSHYNKGSPFPKKGVPKFRLKSFFYSVAEHSVLGARYYMHEGDEERAKLFLLHDALEPFIGGDIPTPYKNHLPQVHEWEAKGQEVLIDAYSLSEQGFSLIKEADKRICRNEAVCLFDDCQKWLHDVEPLFYINGFDRKMIRCEQWSHQKAAEEWYDMALKLELKNKYVT